MIKSDSTISELEKQLEEKTTLLNQRNKEFAVINSVQEGLAKKMDINAIYELVGEKIREIFNAQVIDIVTYDKKTNLIKDRYAYEKGDRTLVDAREPIGFRKIVIDSEKYFLINKDLDLKSKELNSPVIHGEQPKSVVFVPLITNKEVTGMISLQDMDKENAYSDSDVSLLTTLANSMSLALENAKLFDETSHLLKETEQRNAELAVINSVQEGLASELDIKAIYELVGEKMRNIFNAQVIDIVTYDPKLHLIEDQYSYEKGDRTLIGPREPKGFRKHIIESGKVLVNNDKMEEAMQEYDNVVLIGEVPKSQVYTPMISGGQVKGVISLQNLDQENAFSDSDISLLSTLVNSLTVALENARLFDETNRLLKETEQRTAELAVINSVQEGLASELDIKAIYEMVGEKMRNIFNPQVIDIVTYNAKENLIEDQYAYEKGDRTLIGAREPNGFRKYVIENKKGLVINKDMETERLAYDNTVKVGEAAKSIVLVPLVTGDSVTGVISLQNLDQEDAFPESNVNLLNTLANTMSVALENARLFDKTTHLLKETEQRTAELAVINKVQEGLAHELDIQAIYEMVGEKMREIFNAQVIDIVTYDADKNLIEDQYAYEKGDRTMLGPREPKGFRKHIIKSGELLWHNENVEKAIREYNNEVLIGEIPKSQVYAPMIAKGIVKGIISLQNLDEEHAFSTSDISLLSTLVNSMSVALQNARLFDETSRLLKETEQRTAELAVINSVQEGLANELDIQSIYDLVGDRIRDLFKAQVVIIATLDQEKSEEHFKYVWENDKRFHLEPRSLDKLRQHLIKTKQKIVINKDFEKAFANFGMKVAPGTELPQSTVYVPLIIGDKITSYVSLQNVDHENAFSDADVRLLETLSNSMSVALENARLFDETSRLLKETEQRTAELAVINSVQEGLATELDIESIYNLVGERIQNIFDAQAVLIANLDLESKTEVFKFVMEDGEKFTLEPRPFDKLRKHLVQTRQKVVINNSGEAFVWFGNKALPGTKPLQSGAFVPLIIGNKITSYISLQNVDKDNAFSDSDIRLLETLANSMSVALENARLFDETNRLLKETEQRTSELAVINSVQEGLVREMDINAIYKLVGDRLCELFPDTQTLVIRTFDLKTEMEHFQYAMEKGIMMEVDDGPYIWANKLLVKTKQSLLINENYLEVSLKYGGKGVTVGQPPKSAVFVPMIVGDEVKGSISLQNVDTENAFSDSDLRLLTTLTNSMSVALENARLFDETAHLLKETEQRTAELAVINSVQDGLAKEMDIQGIYDLVGEKIRNIFQAQVIDIVTYDKKNNLIEDRYSFEKGDRSLLGPRPLKGIRKHVIESGSTIVINSITDEILLKYDQTILSGEKTKSVVMVPMIAGGEINGVISLQNLDQENAFPESDVKLLNTLANSMSVALENARLFDETTRLLKETEQRTAELAVINSVQGGLAKELEIKGIYDLVGDRIRELFNAQVVGIATLNYAENTEKFQYIFEKGERFYPEPRPLGDLRLHLIKTKSKILINTRKEGIEWFGNEVVEGTEPIKSAVFVPLIIGDKLTSYVTLQNVDTENAFSESDIRLLETLANSMSVALENAVINSVQEGLVREMDMKAIYDLVGNRICNLFDTQTVIIRTFDHKAGNEEWQFAIEKGERIYSKPRPFNWANKLLLTSKQSILINEDYAATAHKNGGTGVTKGLPPKSAVFVPMIVGDTVKGSVSLQNIEKENAFSEADMRLLTTLTNSMSVALENARLFDESNRLLNDAKQRASELATVNNITQALASQINLEELITLVGEEIRQLFKANIVYVALLDKKTNIINFPHQFGDTMDPMQLGEGLTSKIILSGEPLLINKDIRDIEAQMGIKTVGIPAASYLGVPISVGDENIGVLSVQSTEQENRFGNDDMRLLQTIATSVGVALRKATLFEEIHMAKMDAEEAKKTAEKANEAKSSFLSTVSHELRTPLTSVLGFAKIIKKRLEEKIFPITDKTNPKTERTIQQISDNLDVVVSEGQRLTHLINDVLDLAKIEAGKMEWNNEPVSIPEIAERAIAATTSLVDASNLKLVKNIKTDLSEITGDRDKLIQVMVNLISNAVKFSVKGKVTCDVYQKNEEIIMSITDTGIGIAPEDHAAVFEQFKQVGDTLTDKPKGTGLGLPICKEIVEHHGGRIWLESELGVGSTFFVALPVKKSTAEKRPIHLDDLVNQLKEQVAHSKLSVIGSFSTILVVDDDDSIRSLLNQELGEAGYNIIEAANGKAALEAVRKQKPDLIILDIMMPEMNGFDVAAVLKNDPQTMDIPIIVLSIVQDKTRGFRIGVDRYLTKPIDTGLLFSEIGSLLEQGKSKKKVMIVDEDNGTVNTLSEVLKTKGYIVTESNGKELMVNAVANQPDIIIMNSVLSENQEVVKSLRFEKGLENVLFLVYQ